MKLEWNGCIGWSRAAVLICRPQRVLPIAAFVLVLAAVRAPAVEAQHIDVSPGSLQERVRSPFDSTQHWALYVPSRYDGEYELPILFLMDPRGRAMVPMAHARAAAERFGWAVMSSWNTMSDGPVEPNVRALSAMLDDAQSLLRLDTRRFYLAGFSGTARVAWAITPRLDSAVAGILAAGAGTPVRAEWLAGPDAPRVAFFGTAGTTDFNFDEVMGLEPWLTAGNHTYALRSFDGGHQWPPETLFDDAITWFELQAMRAGRAELRQAFVDSLFIAWTARADSLATGASADRLHALDLYQEIARSFASVHQTESVTDRAATLREQDDVRAALQRRTELARESADYSTTFFRVMEQVSNSEGKPSADRIARDLDIERIIRERDAARTHDQRAVAQAAQRKLETVFVNTSFYSPQSFLRTNRPEYALAVLDVANRIYPDHPRVLHSRARARVMQGRADDALDDLEAAVRAGIPASALLDDPMLAPLRDHPRFRDLTAGG